MRLYDIYIYIICYFISFSWQDIFAQQYLKVTLTPRKANIITASIIGQTPVTAVSCSNK